MFSKKKDRTNLFFLNNEEEFIAKKVYIVTEDCIACQTCVAICPDVFAFNEDEQKAYIIKPEGGPEDLIEECIASCPAQCIHWEE